MSCQITVTDAVDGLTVGVPEDQPGPAVSSSSARAHAGVQLAVSPRDDGHAGPPLR